MLCLPAPEQENFQRSNEDFKNFLPDGQPDRRHPDPPRGSYFRLLAQPVVVLRKCRNITAFYAACGLTGYALPFLNSPRRRMAGESKYSLRKMMNLAMRPFLLLPCAVLHQHIDSILFLLLALIEIIYVVSFWFCGRQCNLAPGWSSLMFMLLIIGGFVMISIGIIGVYIGYISRRSSTANLYHTLRQFVRFLAIDLKYLLFWILILLHTCFSEIGSRTGWIFLLNLVL